MKSAIKAFSAVAIAAMVLVSVPACYFSGDTARVTINVGKPPALASHVQAKPGLFSRILAFITLSNNAYADPAPYDWYEIALTVTGDGMDPIEIQIPAETGKASISLPVGERTFTVVVTGDAGNRLYGAIKTVQVSGSNTIDMILGPLPSAPGIYVDLHNESTAEVFVDEWSTAHLVIYKSNSLNGTYTKIGTVTQNLSETLLDGNVVQDATYYYKASGLNEFGEGNFSGVYVYTHDW